MAKKKKIKKEITLVSQNEKDTVLFMTAYDIHKIERNFFRFRRRAKKKELWSQFHISGFSHNNTYITPFVKCHYTAEYNSLNQVTAFKFDEDFERLNRNHKNLADDIFSTLYLQHSAKALLDPSLIEVSTCFKMESFLVDIDSKIYQVDPLAFIMGGSLMVCFELIDFETTVPLEATVIFGRSNNFAIKPIERIKYFDESEFSEDNRKISDIIFENVYGFVTRATRDKWRFGNYSYVHNILVLSNKIERIPDYFQNVLGGKLENFSVNNISATDSFKFYSTEYLGVVTDIAAKEDRHYILYDCIMLECFKIFILLKMIIDYEIHHKMDEIIDHQIYAESQLYPLHAPIITLNAIDNLKKTYSFSRYKRAIDFKLQSLKIYQERKISKNGRLLNILLYILAMLGSAQTLQVLKLEFGLPFNISFWAVMGIFIVFGAIWVVKECKKQ